MNQAEDGQSADAESWKRKYYDGLEQHEIRERQWAQTDELLRKTLSRLTLAADGQDPVLDDHLKALRDAIRDHADVGVLRQRIEAMSKSLVRLDDKPGAQEAAPRPTAVLQSLLDRIALPRGNARRAKALRKTLESAQAIDPEPAVAEFAALLQEVLNASRPDDGAGAAANGGLFARWLGRASGPMLATPAHTTTTEPPAATGDEGGSELLLQLLERLDLPVELGPRVAAIKDDLEARPGSDAQSLVRDIATLIADMRKGLQNEKQEIEAFLKQLTDRLQDIDGYLRGAESARVESYESGRALGDVVERQVQGIEDSVRAAQDLEQLKQTVQQRVEAIIVHVDRHRRDEEQRHRQDAARVMALSERLRAMEAESAQLHERILQEHRQALTDSLTGIPNRLAYQERAAQEYARWKRFATPLALIVWDVDHFKKINDRYGHKAGDKVLKVIAGVLTDNIRETDFLARYGGEEFTLLMTGAALPAIREVAEKLRSAVDHCGFHYRGESVHVTVSCGIAEFRDGDAIEAVFERADRALYRAKHAGRNCCVVAE
ncbi:MAG: GGDEF domain-containing protein [Thiohalobacteraceae bacterium]